MARTRPRTLEQLLGKQKLQSFVDFSEQHKAWQHQLNRCFERLQLQALLPYCEVLNVRAQTLILQVSSAAIGQRIKTEQARIITHFQPDAMPAIKMLEIRIRPQRQNAATRSLQQPPEAKAKQPEDRQNNRESETVRKIREQAELCDEPLRSQLLALAAKYERED